MELDDKTCPQRDQSFVADGSSFGKNSQRNFWQCVPTAPGLSTGQIGDDIGVTMNCTNINNNSCQQFGASTATTTGSRPR